MLPAGSCPLGSPWPPWFGSALPLLVGSALFQILNQTGTALLLHARKPAAGSRLRSLSADHSSISSPLGPQNSGQSSLPEGDLSVPRSVMSF